MSILFAEVEPQDEVFIQATLPQAQCMAQPLHVLPDELLQTATIVCCFIYSKIDVNLLQKMPNLQLLCTRSVGYDHIDLQACLDRNVTVCNVPDYGSHVIAEHVFALLLSQFRHIAEADARTERGEFNYAGLRGIALHNKTIGIVGTGRIGRHVAKIAHGFGMQILATDQCRNLELEHDYNVHYTTLPELLAQSDIVSLHIPATPDTNHVLNADTIATMKHGAVIVNTARGSLIDSQALLNALNSGQIAYALLDTIEHEQNFNETKSLLSHPNVTATPHIGFYADDSVKAMYEVAFTAILTMQAGKVPATVIKPIEQVCDLTPIRV